MDDEERRSPARLFIVLAFLIGSAVLLVSYGIGYDDLFIVLFFAYFLLSALVLRKGQGEGQTSRRERAEQEEWGFDLAPKQKASKEEGWGFDFGDDEQEEFKSLIKTPEKERDPYSDQYESE